jgi:hypothetical protein
MYRKDIWSMLIGSHKAKLVMLAIEDNCPLSDTELDEIEQDEALQLLEQTGLIERKGNGWILTGSRRKGGDDQDVALAKRMFDRIKVVSPSAKQPSWITWSDDLRLMRVMDSRTRDEIEALFVFATHHTFWAANILSPKKLRKHWDRLEAERRKDGDRRRTAAERFFPPTARVVDGSAARRDEQTLPEVRRVVRKPD